MHNKSFPFKIKHWPPFRQTLIEQSAATLFDDVTVVAVVVVRVVVEVEVVETETNTSSHKKPLKIKFKNFNLLLIVYETYFTCKTKITEAFHIFAIQYQTLSSILANIVWTQRHWSCRCCCRSSRCCWCNSNGSLTKWTLNDLYFRIYFGLKLKMCAWRKNLI